VYTTVGRSPVWWTESKGETIVDKDAIRRSAEVSKRIPSFLPCARLQSIPAQYPRISTPVYSRLGRIALQPRRDNVKSRKVTIAHKMSEVEVTTIARERSCLCGVLFGYQGGTIVEPRPDALPALCRIRPVLYEIAKREIACACACTFISRREQPQHSSCLQKCIACS
jgi:hypothetical protein